MGHTERALKALGATVGATLDDELSRLPPPEGEARLLVAAARARHRRGLLRGAGATALALAAGTLLFLSRPRPLSFEVGGAGPGRVDAWIAAQNAALPLRFSDGTELTLATEARARVVAVEDRGARVLLESGRLSAAVVHRGKTRWVVAAGPFEVLVTGTRFDVAWTPEAELFQLDLREGAVTVTGPLLGEGRRVAAGESVKIAVRTGRLEISGEAASAPTATPVTPRPTSAPEPTSAGLVDPAPPDPPARPTSARLTAPEPTTPGFRDLAAAGKYAEAVRAAEAEGFAAVCDRASAADLMALADAARFSGNAARAGEALGALRRRFPGDARGAMAAFLMGRTAFEQRGAYAEAARWFSAYLAEQPGGALAREALGRLMECRERLGDRAAARALATQYLAAFPGGPHAEKATSLLQD